MSGFLPVLVYGQEFSNEREKFLLHLRDSLFLDSLAIVPGSIQVWENGTPADTAVIVIWYRSLIIPHRPMDSVRIVYRVFDFPAWKKSQDSPVSVIPMYSLYEEEPLPEQNFLSATGLNTDGHLTRGIMFGTGTEPGFTSDFSLKMSGNLSEDVRIEAEIADNQLNAQQYAGTYNFRDFDRALINVYFPNARLTAGDFNTGLSIGKFVRYSRNIKGMMYSQHDSAYEYRAGAGIQKGIFRVQKFMGKDGNQGPYRLTGSNNEEFIVIVTGSERVYIDGNLKQRGIDKDYVIDYSRAEITFTPSCPITADSRIIVEFEYWTNDFLRTAMFWEYNAKVRNGRIYAGALRVGDNVSLTATNLTTAQLRFLSGIGDSLDRALWLSADSVGANNPEAFYCLVDTIVDGQVYRIFKYSPGSPCAVWKVDFSYVGTGQGEYRILANGGNVRAFEWVGPGKGGYMPYRRLSVPQRKEVLAAGGRFALSKGWSFSADFALGRDDLNLLSTLDDGDNNSVDFALLLGRKTSVSVAGFDSALVSFDYRYMQEDFPVFDRFLPVEFGRDWNLEGVQGDMHQGGMTWKMFSQEKSVGMTAGLLVVPGLYKGYRTDLAYREDNGDWNTDIWLSGNFTNNQGAVVSFWRGKGQVARKFEHWTLGVTYDGERNLWRTDSLLPFSHAYFQNGVFVQTGDTAAGKLRLSYNIRENFDPGGNVLSRTYLSHNLGLRAYKTTRLIKQDIVLTYRRIFSDTAQMTNVLLHSRTSLKLGKWGMVNLVAQSQNGSQPVTEFRFVQVPAGLGQYVWIDFNGDGQQQINEFQLTDFPDQARYVRVILPSNSYINVTDNSLKMSFSVSPRLKPVNFVNRVINRLSGSFSVTINRKDRNPYSGLFATEDTSVVYSNIAASNRLEFRLSDKAVIGFLSGYSSNKDLLLGGFQGSQQSSGGLSFKYDFAARSNFILSAEKGIKSMQSQLFAQSNYSYGYRGVNLQIAYSQPVYSVNGTFRYQTKQTQSANVRSVSLRAAYGSGFSKKLRWNVSALYIYNGVEGSLAGQEAYSILEGYRQGNNLNMGCSVFFKIMPKLTLNASYNLRMLQTDFVQTFNVQINGRF